MTTTKEMPRKPEPIARAEHWFQENYSSESVSAVCAVKGGKASGLLYIPPVEPAVLQLILQLAEGMFKNAPASAQAEQPAGEGR